MDRNKNKNHGNRIWKKMLISMSMVLALADITGSGVRFQAADVVQESDCADYAETEYTDQEVEETEEADVTETDRQDLENEVKEEQILDQQEEEQIASEQLDEQKEDRTEIQEEEFFDESAEAGNAMDGSGITGRSTRRARTVVRFQDCYGDQLNEGAREVYDAMMKAWANGGTDTFKVTFATPLTFETTGTYVTGEDGKQKWKWVAADGKDTNEKMNLDPAYGEVMEELRRNVQGGFDAGIYDTPEMFWLKKVSFGYSLVWNIRKDGSATGTIREVSISGIEAWTGAKSSVSEFQRKVSDAVGVICASFTDSMTDAQKMKRIHDYICAKCVYQEGTYAHSAYGTFYNGKVVCEGYAKAFKILCNRIGLNCALGSGTVHKPSSDGAHMWNYVFLNGGWYMVDATWDDGTTLSDRYLFAGSETDGIYDKISRERTNYTIFSTRPETAFRFVQPTLQETTYHENTEIGRMAASCVSDGYLTLQCQLCDEVTKTAIPATGHSYGEWKTTVEAGCETPGSRTRICKTCQNEEREAIPATGHSYGEWETTAKAGCETPGSRTRICKMCQSEEREVIPSTGHSYGEWRTIRRATALENGEMRRSCQNENCESTENKILPRISGFVKLNAGSLKLQTRQSTTGLRVTAMAEGDRVINWKSSRPEVASVSKKGKITGKKTGTAVITVTLASGATAQCKVKVQKKEVQPVGLSISCSRLKNNRITLKKGQSVRCTVVVRPFTSKTKVIFTSKNKKIAKVSQKGRIKAAGAGKTKITIKAGTKKKTVWVIVKK